MREEDLAIPQMSEAELQQLLHSICSDLELEKIVLDTTKYIYYNVLTKIRHCVTAAFRL